MRTTIDHYMNLPYHLVLVADQDEDGNAGWVAEISELPGCISQGATPDEAVRKVRDAMGGWLAVALEDGSDIPEPRSETSYSGRFVARIPKSLHAELVRAAEEDGVSLNQFVSSALAGAVHWRAREKSPVS
jgi:predicted RNase H-like HicB family nuclease